MGSQFGQAQAVVMDSPDVEDRIEASLVLLCLLSDHESNTMHVATQQLRPFRFTNLPQVRRSDIRFFDILSRTMPAELFEQALLDEMMQVVGQYVHSIPQWSWTGQEQVLQFSELERYCLSPTLLIQIALLPSEHRILLEVDPRIAASMVDRALGGSGDSLEECRPLTEVEKGVFTFLFLKLIQRVQATWGDQAQMEFRLDRLDDDLSTLHTEIDAEALYYRKEMRLQLNNLYGFARLHVPTALVDEMAQRVPEIHNTPQEHDFLRNHIHRVAEVPLSGSLQIGVVDLTLGDLEGLEEDDIVLLRECFARRMENGQLEGEALLRFGPKTQYGIRCSIQDQLNPPQSAVRLEAIEFIAEPEVNGQIDRSEYEMDDNQNYADEYQEGAQYQEGEGYQEYADEGYQGENFDEMGAVVSDVPVPLVVELGRVECNARDIMYLRVGQVMDLRRSPYDYLDLVVNGQPLGKGELVEIEGQLGIRIIELSK